MTEHCEKNIDIIITSVLTIHSVIMTSIHSRMIVEWRIL